jgi:hypothetical protein
MVASWTGSTAQQYTPAASRPESGPPLASPAVGSSGQKSRKGKKRQHLAKVGTQSGAAGVHAEQHAVMDTMGIGGSPAWLRVTAMVIIVVLVIGAIGGLIVLTTR